MEQSKEFWKSRTFWVAIITAVMPLIPPVAVFQAANPALYNAALSLLFGGIMRTMTSTPISWVFKKDASPT